MKYNTNFNEFLKHPIVMFPGSKTAHNVIDRINETINAYGRLNVAEFIDIVNDCSTEGKIVFGFNFNPSLAKKYGWKKEWDRYDKIMKDFVTVIAMTPPRNLYSEDDKRVRYHKDFEIFMKNPMFVFERDEDVYAVEEDIDLHFETNEFLSIHDICGIISDVTKIKIEFEKNFNPGDFDSYGFFSQFCYWCYENSQILHFTLPVRLVKYGEEEKKQDVIPDISMNRQEIGRMVMKDMPETTKNVIRFYGTARNSGRYPFDKNQVDCCGGIPRVAAIKSYNDRVVLVRFADGTFTKSVCQGADVFDLDTGISICLTKRMLSRDSREATRLYNDMIREAHKREERRQKRLADIQKVKAEARERDRQRQERARKRKERKQAEWRENVVQAIRESKNSGITLVMNRYEPEDEGGEE